MDDMKEALAECCKKLRLSASLASRAMTQEGENNQEFLLNLLTSEIANREAARITRNMNMAGFPCRYRAEQYRTDEIDFPDGVSFESLLALDFYKGGKNVIMYGGTGTGKTMLSILIGMAACRENILMFTTVLARMPVAISRLITAQLRHSAQFPLVGLSKSLFISVSL